MRHSVVALTLAFALTACRGEGDSSTSDGSTASAARSPKPTSASEAPTGATSANAAAAAACIETGLALTPLANGLTGGDLESALLDAKVPDWEPSGTTPTVELALARMELELSFAKQSVELGVFGAGNRAGLQRAYDALADTCEGIGSGF